jgi:MYXO-CTERM domain-containing protein
MYNWTAAHRVHLWVLVMRRLTELGDPPSTRAAAAVAGVCLAASWRQRRWLPPLLLGLLVVGEAVLTPAIQHTVHEVGPPGTRAVATWPSGGCGRVIVFYGLIAYLLWREHSGRRSTGVWAAAAVVALAFNEAYSRAYLTIHWFIDVPSGCVYGVLMLLLMVTGVRLIVGPATGRSAPAYHLTPTPTTEHAARQVI